MTPADIAQLGGGPVLTAIVWAIYLWAQGRKGKSQAREIIDQALTQLVGKDAADATPKDVRDQTGAIRLAVRKEVDPKFEAVITEQRRQGRLLDQHGEHLELLTQGQEAAVQRETEISNRLAVLESKAQMSAVAERIGGT